MQNSLGRATESSPSAACTARSSRWTPTSSPWRSPRRARAVRPAGDRPRGQPGGAEPTETARRRRATPVEDGCATTPAVRLNSDRRPDAGPRALAVWIPPVPGRWPVVAAARPQNRRRSGARSTTQGDRKPWHTTTGTDASRTAASRARLIFVVLYLLVFFAGASGSFTERLHPNWVWTWSAARRPRTVASAGGQVPSGERWSRPGASSRAGSTRSACPRPRWSSRATATSWSPSPARPTTAQGRRRRRRCGSAWWSGSTGDRPRAPEPAVGGAQRAARASARPARKRAGGAARRQRPAASGRRRRASTPRARPRVPPRSARAPRHRDRRRADARSRRRSAPRRGPRPAS